MKVVLRKEVLDLGDEDSILNVSEGYARNFLFPRKLAVPATSAEIVSVEKRKGEREKKVAEKRVEVERVAQQISALEISIPAEAGEGGKLFGSVTAPEIVAALKEQAQIEIDKRKLEMTDPIRTLGDHQVKIKLYQDIVASLKVKVLPK
jgi:large subunit ribosomal protein L9